MKIKHILFVFISIVITSCNSNDDSDAMSINLEINKQNLIGKWFVKEESTNGGGFENYQHNCTTLKDFQELLVDNTMKFVGYDSNCQINDLQEGIWYLDGTELMIDNYDPITSPDFFTVLSVTLDELRLKQTANTPNGVEVYEIHLTKN
ncbi:MAG: hypothetical protein ACI9FW_001747 [Flavobacterium sp.]|jgi:hypothetical protein